MSHRRLSKTARHHLLAVVSKAHERATKPPYVAKAAPAQRAGDRSALDFLAEALRRSNRCIVLPPEVQVQIIPPPGYVRVVGGKGGRERGVRGLVKLGPNVPRFGTQRRAPAPATGVVQHWTPSRGYSVGEVKMNGLSRRVRSVGSA